ncbi:MAG: class I SAM-dependent methyltransferase [Eubacteriales bacterium]
MILGAGMDTFAFRRPELVKQLQVFEVDHPATQVFKRRRLTELGWEHPAQLHFIPVDFTQESLAPALTRSSYDPQAPSFFSWLGAVVA